MTSKVTLIFAIAAVGLAGCADKEAQRQEKVQQGLLADKTVPVTFVQPVMRDVKATLSVSGPLKTLDEVTLGSKVTGRLVMVSVKDGSPVKRGQIIARIESSDLIQQVQQALAAVQVAESAKQQAEIQAKISPQQSQAAIRQAEAALNSAKARLALVQKGARSQERAQAQERVNQAKAQLNKAKADLERARKLFEGGAIARADVDAAQLSYDTALANYNTTLEALDAIIEGARPEELQQAQESVRQAEEQLRIAKANSVTDQVRRQQVQQAEASLAQARASLRLAQLQLADANIVAPVSGYVSGMPAQVGQVVGPGTPVAKIVGLEGVYFEAQIPETEIANVKLGQPAEVRVDAYPNRVFSGTVVAVNPQASSLGRLFSARISVTDPGNALRPGMFGKGEIVLSTIPDAVLIPMDAVLKEDEKTFVYVGANNKARRVFVTLGRMEGKYVLVKGLAPSDKVILKGKDSVTEGVTIRPDKPAEGVGA